MTVTESEKQEQFMLLLLQLATRRERQIIQDNRQLFLETMRDLRRLVQRMSFDGEFRSYEWRQLQREAPRLINNFRGGVYRDVDAGVGGARSSSAGICPGLCGPG